MLKLPPLAKNPTLNQIILRVFKLIVVKSGGYVEVTPNKDGKKIGLRAIMKNGDYILDLNLTACGPDRYSVTNFSSIEKDSDQGAPYWMPADWTLKYALRPKGVWTISKGVDVVALLKAHTGWSKLEGYFPVFTWKDNI